MNRRVLSTAAVILILLLAAYLRLWNLGASEFKYDEARVCNLAGHFVDTGIPPLRGMGSSIGIDNPPLTIYLISLPVLFSRDPLIVTAFVALLNVVAVWGCYWLGRRYWSQGMGLLAACLLAISPWAVFYSRKVWAQDLLLPGVILFFAFLLAWLVDGHRWALSGAIVTLTALTQIHFSTLAFIPLLALLLLAKFVSSLRSSHRERERTDVGTGLGTGPAGPLWQPLLVGIGASALLYAPYFVFDSQVEWRNVRTFVAVMGSPGRTSWEALRFALLNVGGREIHALAGPERFQDYLRGIVDLAYWPDRVEEGVVVASLAYLLIRWWRKRAERRAFGRDGLLLLWLVAPVLFYMRVKSAVFPHYLIPLYPAPYLAVATTAVDLARSRLASRHARAIHFVGALTLGALIVWQSYLSLSIHAYVDEHDTPGGMGTPIRIHRDVVRVIERYAAAWQNRQVVMLCPGDDPRWDECPAVYGFMTSRTLDMRFVDRDASLLFPRSDADTLVALAPGESLAAAELPRHARELSEERVSLREGAEAYRFFRLPAGYVPEPVVRPDDAPVRLANGVSLSGYGLVGSLAADETVRLRLYWRVDALPPAPPAQGYSFANHLLAADGERYGQRDGPGHRVDLWRTGDAYISWFDIALAAEARPAPYRLRIGIYIYTPPDQFTAIPVVDGANEPIAEAVEWTIAERRECDCVP